MVEDSISKPASFPRGLAENAVAGVGGVDVNGVVVHLNFLDRRGTPSGVARTQLETVLLVDANANIRARLDVAIDVVGVAEGVDMHSSLLSCSIQNEGLYGSLYAIRYAQSPWVDCTANLTHNKN